MEASILLAIGSSLLVRLPVLGALTAGLVLAISRQKSLATSGFALMLGDMIVGTGVQVAIPFYLRESGTSAASMGMYFTIWGIISSLIAAGAWALILMALFQTPDPPAPAGRVGANPSANPF